MHTRSCTTNITIYIVWLPYKR